jgi:hypothetical protein
MILFNVQKNMPGTSGYIDARIWAFGGDYIWVWARTRARIGIKTGIWARSWVVIWIGAWVRTWAIARIWTRL